MEDIDEEHQDDRDTLAVRVTQLNWSKLSALLSLQQQLSTSHELLVVVRIVRTFESEHEEGERSGEQHEDEQVERETGEHDLLDSLISHLNGPT